MSHVCQAKNNLHKFFYQLYLVQDYIIRIAIIHYL